MRPRLRRSGVQSEMLIPEELLPRLREDVGAAYALLNLASSGRLQKWDVRSESLCNLCKAEGWRCKMPRECGLCGSLSGEYVWE